MTEPTSRPNDDTTIAHDDERARPRTRAARYPHAPERLPDRAGRFLGLLDRSRRDDRRASA